jgi:hypothetical protein
MLAIRALQSQEAVSQNSTFKIGVKLLNRELRKRSTFCLALCQKSIEMFLNDPVTRSQLWAAPLILMTWTGCQLHGKQQTTSWTFPAVTSIMEGGMSGG